MGKRQVRNTTAHKFRTALDALEGSKTISQCLNDRTPAEEHCVLRRRRPVLCRSVPASSVPIYCVFPVLWSKVGGHFSVGERAQGIRIPGCTLD